LAQSAHAWEGDKLKVCADPNNPPYSDAKGQGFENKIAELLGDALDKKLEYTWFPQRMGFIRNTLKAQLPDSEEYKCDVVIGWPTGAEMAATTDAYYCSTYALVYVKKRGWDDIKSADDLAQLPQARKAKLKLAMFDGSPATTWLLNHNLVEYAIPYQTMTGDASVNTAMTLEKDMLEGKLDMAIVWGPIAGYLEYHNKPKSFELIPMRSEPGVKFEFPMSMGVRMPDKARKAELNALIEKKADAIEDILRKYHVPLLDIGKDCKSPARD
jgi:quinoprotein dehydrogenase-associated probable ABC transporter substrate-binding protein